MDLFINHDTDESKNFKGLIRQYNNSLAFASLTAKFIGNSNRFTFNKNGPYCLRIDGQIYHNVSHNLYPKNKDQASYCQLYILDPITANNIRLQNPANKNMYKKVL